MKLLLIDGSNLIFRGYYATEKHNIMTPSGEPANAVHTLVGMINKMIVEHKPTHVFIGLDTGKSTFRHEAYPEYKGKRSETPEQIKSQFQLAKNMYDAMGIKYDATELYEADDLIATYVEKILKIGAKVTIVLKASDATKNINIVYGSFFDVPIKKNIVLYDILTKSSSETKLNSLYRFVAIDLYINWYLLSTQ